MDYLLPNAHSVIVASPPLSFPHFKLSPVTTQDIEVCTSLSSLLPNSHVVEIYDLPVSVVSCFCQF